MSGRSSPKLNVAISKPPRGHRHPIGVVLLLPHLFHHLECGVECWELFGLSLLVSDELADNSVVVGGCVGLVYYDKADGFVDTFHGNSFQLV